MVIILSHSHSEKSSLIHLETYVWVLDYLHQVWNRSFRGIEKAKYFLYFITHNYTSTAFDGKDKFYLQIRYVCDYQSSFSSKCL